MSEKVLQGAPPVAITLRRSTRARRITLRVSGIDNRVTMTLPKGVSEREAMAFATQKEAWIRSHLAQHTGPERIGIGSQVPVQGQMMEIVPGQGRKVVAGGDTLQVPGAPEQAGARVLGYLKTRARNRCSEAADHYGALLGRRHTGLSIRDTRSRWGSCTSQGRLMLSWRLILAPPQVLDYVVAHEVAHLAEMNHSPAFWDIVAQIYGPHKDMRTWLRDHGARLHRYRFTD